MSNYITKEGLSNLKIELNELKTITIPKIQDDIREARSLGDLRENTPLDVAKTQEQNVNFRVLEIENILSDYKIIEDDETATKVKIGTHVKIKYLSTKIEFTLTIVGSFEVDPTKGKISNESPLAKAILGKKLNDEVEFKIQAQTHRVKIIEIN